MRRRTASRWFRPAVFGCVVVVVIGSMVWVVRSLMSGAEEKKPSVREVVLLRPPPPPPPQEKPPPPEVKKEEVKIDQPKPEQPEAKQDQPPPGDKLGVDAEGTGAGDSFGLIGNKGGADLLGAGSRFGRFTGRLQDEIQEALAQDKKLRGASYQITVHLWLTADGAVQRLELVGSTGNEETDQALKASLANIRIHEAPPADMPQPIGLRINSRA